MLGAIVGSLTKHHKNMYNKKGGRVSDYLHGGY